MNDTDLSAAVDDVTARVVDARHSEDGTVGWVSFDTDDHHHPGGRTVARASPGVYSGRLGVAVYLTALEAVDGGWAAPRMDTDSLRADLAPADVRDYTRRLGVGLRDGLGSVVYGLSLLTELTGDERHTETAQAVTRAFSSRRVESVETTNVIDGLAGAVHGLCKLHEVDGTGLGLTRAVDCGERLLEFRYPKWGTTAIDTHPGSVTTCCTGVARGAAGVAHALYRLYGHTGRTEFRDAADDVLVFERAFYEPSRHNWLANWSDVPNFRRWWSQGTPGIGLARLGSLAAHSAAHLREDLRRAAGYTPRLGRRDSLRRGTFAQVAFLIELARHDGESCGDARRLAARAVERRRSAGDYRLVGRPSVTNPSLFFGLAGVGYTLLRLFAPERLPSLGRLE